MPSAGVSPAMTSWSVGVRPRLAVDPQTVLDREPAAAAAELPDRAAAQPEQGALPVGGRRHLDRGREVEADRERHRLGAPLRPVAISRSSPASWRPSPDRFSRRSWTRP